MFLEKNFQNGFLLNKIFKIELDHGSKLPLRLQLSSGGVSSDLVSYDCDLHPDPLQLHLQPGGLLLLLLLLRGEQGPQLGTSGVEERLAGGLSRFTI